MKDIGVKILVVCGILFLSIVFEKLTYFIQDNYGYEWLWTFVRALPLTLVVIYILLKFPKKK